ncbi:MAG: undecaprenyl-diphosphatase UppP [Patescibacteria group bacterium]|jgi:undecaprenyl-diphosphatase
MDYIINYLQPIILGALQGLTEFLPISSSGHLVIIRQLFGWDDQGALFDAVLHLASVIAIFIYFRADWSGLIHSLASKPKTHIATTNRRLLLLLAVGTIPAIAVGMLLNDMLENQSRSLVIVASLFIFTAILFWLSERLAQPRKHITKLSFFDALGIGIAQAGAMLPGVSRSGFTIAAGMYFGLKREEAAKFSFLLAAPALVLAGGYALLQLESSALATDWIALMVGFVISLISSLAAIALMMRFLKFYRLSVFSWYLVIVGLALIGMSIFHVGIPLSH